jgi:site-specific DNA recombinase
VDSVSRSRIRCAIYTRKSTQEGLELEFNSLHAQREAAEAYIKSQKHLGWMLLPIHYDDGGFSGGSMDRPALQRLLEDIESKRIDCVVVYKVDRLSRSLLDFARLIEKFDQCSVSFVSVTQQFNTTTSLGRLTLNILLSFAQFEREIIGERTRDKMAAARRKGKWIGGMPVLGYDVAPEGGRLVVNEGEAGRVREIFSLFESKHSLPAVVLELKRRGWTLKTFTSKSGIHHVGRPFNNASLRRLLNNPIYAGRVEYGGGVYPGEHRPIVETEAWESVNDELRSERYGMGRTNQKQNALLRGVLICGSCEQPMLPTYTGRKNRRYSYYVCRSARLHGWNRCPTKSVSGGRIESSVVEQIRSALSNQSVRHELGVAEADWQTFLSGDTRLITSIVERVTYDAIEGRVALKLQSFDRTEEDR